MIVLVHHADADRLRGRCLSARSRLPGACMRIASPQIWRRATCRPPRSGTAASCARGRPRKPAPCVQSAGRVLPRSGDSNRPIHPSGFAIGSLGETRDVMIVGHMPSLPRILQFLLATHQTAARVSVARSGGPRRGWGSVAKWPGWRSNRRTDQRRSTTCGSGDRTDQEIRSPPDLLTSCSISIVSDQNLNVTPTAPRQIVEVSEIEVDAVWICSRGTNGSTGGHRGNPRCR